MKSLSRRSKLGQGVGLRLVVSKAHFLLFLLFPPLLRHELPPLGKVMLLRVAVGAHGHDGDCSLHELEEPRALLGGQIGLREVAKRQRYGGMIDAQMLLFDGHRALECLFALVILTQITVKHPQVAKDNGDINIVFVVLFVELQRPLIALPRFCELACVGLRIAQIAEGGGQSEGVGSQQLLLQGQRALQQLFLLGVISFFSISVGEVDEGGGYLRMVLSVDCKLNAQRSLESVLQLLRLVELRIYRREL